MAIEKSLAYTGTELRMTGKLVIQGEDSELVDMYVYYVEDMIRAITHAVEAIDVVVADCGKEMAGDSYDELIISRLYLNETKVKITLRLDHQHLALNRKLIKGLMHAALSTEVYPLQVRLAYHSAVGATIQQQVLDCVQTQESTSRLAQLMNTSFNASDGVIRFFGS